MTSTTKKARQPRLYKFGPYELEWPNGQLSLRGNPVSIQPRQISVLQLLLDSEGNVVSKDEMVRRVWEGAHIEDSNITKAVAEIRRILRPGFRDVDPIRTVWKQGYRLDIPVEVRFAEPEGGDDPARTTAAIPVTEREGSYHPPLPLLLHEAAEPPGPAAAEVPTAVLPRRAVWLAAACAICTLGVAGALLARIWPAGDTRFSAAVLGIRNISEDQASSGWIATAVSEMLSTELEGGADLRVVPTDDVAHMRSDLGLAAGAEYDSAALRRVRGLLQCRWAITGSYLLAGKTLRVDLRIRDTQSGDVASVVSETGDEDHLLELVSRAGVKLRGAMGRSRSTRPEAVQADANAEALRLYAQGLDSVRAWNTAAAQESLSAAARLAPRYAPIHTALSQTWELMGFDRNAREEAQLAFDSRAGLPREQQLRIEARYAEATADWPKAIEIWRAMQLLYPLQTDYSERLAATLRSGGKAAESVAMLRKLHSLEPALLLAEAEGDVALGDFKGAVRVASAAIDASHARSAALLEERALDIRGQALAHTTEFERSHTDFQQAEHIGAAIGDQGGMARALLDEGDSFRIQGKTKQAGTPLERALAVARTIGDRQTVVRCLMVLGNVHRNSGDLPGAKQRFEEALAQAQEIGNGGLENSAQLNVGNALLNTGDPLAARQNYNEIYARAKEMGDRSTIQLVLGNIATVDYFLGNLPLATSEFQEALSISQQTGERQSSTYKQIFLARIALSAGDLKTARSLLDDATRTLKSMGAAVTEPVIWQGALAIAEGHPEAAEAPLNALGGKNSLPGPGTKALIVLAESWLVRGDLAKAKQVADHAVAVAAKSPNRADYGLPADLISARIAIASGDVANKGQRLQALLEEARKLHNIPHEFTARLAMSELAAHTGNRTLALLTIGELKRDAGRLGFGSVTSAATQLTAKVNGPLVTQAVR